jgi:hypothetical protein
MPARLQRSDVKALLLWAVLTAAMFAVLMLLIVQINIEPPRAAGQILVSVISFFVISVFCCSVVALVFGLPLIALTRTRMQTSLSAATVHGAILGLASVIIWMLFSFGGSMSSVFIVLLLGTVYASGEGRLAVTRGMVKT